MSSAYPPTDHRRQAGFTLTELAVVFAIVALLLGGMTFTLTAQVESRALTESQRRISDARELLIAFAQANGRLPCPARYAASGDHSAGLESFCAAASGSCDIDPDASKRTTTIQTHGNCAHFYDGYLPAAAIGYTPIDSAGFALDSWGSRIRYAVARKTAHPSGTTTCKKLSGTLLTGTQSLFTKTRASDETLIGCVPDEIVVCASASGVTPTTCGSAPVVTNQNVAVAVVLTTGKNYATSQTRARALALGRTDEAANLDGDGVFVWHAPRPEPNEFDDQVVWLPASMLYGRMIAAGVLP